MNISYWFSQFDTVRLNTHANVYLVLGIVWGLIPMRGLAGLVTFGLINAGSLYVYSNNYQSVDEEEYGGPWEMVKEGFMTSFAGFLVSWICVYSAFHFD